MKSPNLTWFDFRKHVLEGLLDEVWNVEDTIHFKYSDGEKGQIVSNTGEAKVFQSKGRAASIARVNQVLTTMRSAV